MQDRDTYEWMKYKVAAEVGGDAEKEAFKLFEKLKVDQKGEAGYRLWRDQISKDPQTKVFIPYFWKNCWSKVLKQYRVDKLVSFYETIPFI